MTPRSYPHKFENTVVGWYVTWFIGACCTLVVWAAVSDARGRQAWNHPERLPSTVTRLSDSSYLIDSSSSLQATDICRGTYRSDDSVYAVVNLERSKGSPYTWVECSREQTWADARPVSVNFGRAFVNTLGSTGFIVVVLFGLFCVSIYPTYMFCKISIPNRREQKAEEKKKALGTLEQRRTALSAAYFSGSIDESEYQEKCDLLEKEAAAA